MSRRNRLAAALLAALLLTAGACGTSGGKQSSTKQTTRTTTTERSSSTTGPSSGDPSTSGPDSTAPTSAPDPRDRRRAQAANIVAGDLPPGWTSTPRSEGTSTIFARCAPEIDLEASTAAVAGSPDFSRRVGASLTQANSVTRILASRAVAKAVVSKVGDASFVSCVDNAIKTQGLKRGTATGALAPVKVSGLGDEAAGMDGSISGVDATTGKAVTVGVSIVAIGKADLVTVLTGSSSGGTQPGDDALFRKLAQAVADRQQS